MKIKQTLTIQMILCTTAAFVTGVQAMEDDLANHYTRVGGRTIPHTPTPGAEIPADGTIIVFDDCLPKSRQLSLRPRGKIISYTCPAVAGIKGLEKPRSMGISSVHLTQESDPMRPMATGIEVIKASYNIAGLSVTAGSYRISGTVNLSSKIDKGQRVDTKRLTCRTGQNDGLIINIEYNEFMHHIPHSFAFSKGCLTRENPKAPTASPWFTFSCWVLPVQQNQEIFSWTYLAPEPELKGQQKRLSIGISHSASQRGVHCAYLRLPVVETSTKDKVIPAVTKIVPTPKTIMVDEKYVDKKVIQGVVIVPTASACSSTVFKNVNNDSVATLQRLGLNLGQIGLASQGKLKLPGVTVSQSPWMAARKNGKLKLCGTQYTCSKTVTENKVRKVSKTTMENKTVEATPAKKVKETFKTLKQDVKYSPLFATSAAGWVHLQFFVDASKKSMNVHVNNENILTVSNPNIISLNELCSLEIGDSRYPTQGLIADINLANGQKLNPPAFCNITSQGILTPKNFTGPFGPNGFQLRGGPALNLVTRNVPDTSPNKTQWKAQWEANGSVTFPPKSPTTF